MRDVLLIVAAAALLIGASVPLTQWANDNLSAVTTDDEYGAVSNAFVAASAAFLAVLGAVAAQLGLRAWRAGLVAVAATAMSYAAAVPIRQSLFTGADWWHVVLPGGPMTGVLVVQPVVVAVVLVVAALLSFVITTSAAWLWGRVRAWIAKVGRVRIPPQRDDTPNEDGPVS